MTMFAGVVHGRDDIRYEETEKPKPKAGEVLVKVKYTGICGSDVPRVLGDACHFTPIILGHEFSGIITEIGEGVTERQEGQRVAGVPIVPCMKCEDCKKGLFSLCKYYSFIGSRRNGSFAEYIVCPAENTVPVADSVSYEMAALFEPSTVALHGLRCADYRPGKTTAIIGAGTIGLLTAHWCQAYGARNLTVLSHNRRRRCNVGSFIDTSETDFYDSVLAQTNGRGFDYVFEAVGNAETVKLAFRIAANRAHVCLIGTPKKDLTFTISEWEQIGRKELKVSGSWMSYSAPFPGEEWEETAAFMESGALQIDESMIFKKYPLSKIADAFDLYRTPGAVRGKILIDSEGL